eukprot:jgi/Bigna1/139769/aug1.52_g14477
MDNLSDLQQITTHWKSMSLDQKWKYFQKGFDMVTERIAERLAESLEVATNESYKHKDISFREVVEKIATAKSVVLITGAGVSLASGIPTYRGSDGYWTLGSENYTPQEIATAKVFHAKTAKCQEYYSKRYQQCRKATPNQAHHAIARLESFMNSKAEKECGEGRDAASDPRTLSEAESCRAAFTLISQNIDGLHLAAGSKNLLEIHGNLSYARCFDAKCPQSKVLVPFPNPREDGGSGKMKSHAPKTVSSKHRSRNRGSEHPATKRERDKKKDKPTNSAETSPDNSPSSSADTQLHLCKTCKKAPLRPNILFFDESYDEHIYKAKSAMNAVEQCDLLLMSGTMACTGLPHKLLAKAAERKLDIVDINPERNDDIKHAPLLHLKGRAEELLPRIVHELIQTLSKDIR